MADSESHRDADVDGSTLPEDSRRRPRWRLVMGAGSESLCGGLSGQEAMIEQAVAFLYDREGDGRNVRRVEDDRRGSLDPSQLTVPDWINQVHDLFPKEAIERLERDALERYQLDEMVTNVDVLARAEPNTTLLKAVLRTQHLMNADVLDAARALVRRVVDRLMEELASEVRTAFQGTVDRRHRSFMKVAKNFDIDTTLRRNLKHYDPATGRVVVQTPYFFSRTHRQVDKWQMIILIDESGSMLDSVIHSAIMAAIFYGLNMMKLHLCIFDTEVVDLTDQITDPVETLTKVQLGGGTDIGHAVRYASQLVENPSRTIIVLVTDFYEGGPVGNLYSVGRSLVESGCTCLGLAALNSRGEADYDRTVAAQMVRLGWHVAAMTPGELADWVAEKVRG